MKIKKRQLELNNVIGYESVIDRDIDLFDQVYEAGTIFKEMLVQNGYYPDGPTIFKYSPFDEDSEITLLTTVGNKLNIVGENKSQFFFKENLSLTSDYFYRHYDQEEVIPYQILKEKLEADNFTLVSFYHIILDLYGDIVVDIYCEVTK